MIFVSEVMLMSPPGFVLEDTTVSKEHGRPGPDFEGDVLHMWYEHKGCHA